MKSLKYEIVAVLAVCVAALSAHAVEWALTVEKDGATESDTYTFFDDNGAWKLCGINASK